VHLAPGSIPGRCITFSFCFLGLLDCCCGGGNGAVLADVAFFYVVARAREVRTTSTNNTVEIGCHAKFTVLNNCVHRRVCFHLLVACMHAGGWTLWRTSLRLCRITTPGHILLSIDTINLLYIRLFYHNTREMNPLYKSVIRNQNIHVSLSFNYRIIKFIVVVSSVTLSETSLKAANLVGLVLMNACTICRFLYFPRRHYHTSCPAWSDCDLSSCYHSKFSPLHQ
jgi:hypothetical protein